jgi:hypothetical protein
MRRRFVSRSKFETLSAGCRRQTLDWSDSRDINCPSQFHRSTKSRRQSTRTEAIVTLLGTVGSHRSFLTLRIAAAMMFASINRCHWPFRHSTARPPHGRTNQHG